jgi:hypothetical protein
MRLVRPALPLSSLRLSSPIWRRAGNGPGLRALVVTYRDICGLSAGPTYPPRHRIDHVKRTNTQKATEMHPSRDPGQEDRLASTSGIRSQPEPPIGRVHARSELVQPQRPSVSGAQGVPVTTTVQAGLFAGRTAHVPAHPPYGWFGKSYLPPGDKTPDIAIGLEPGY